MDFKSPKIRHWFLTEISDENTSADLYEVEIFEDCKRSKLAIRKDEIIGVFTSEVELNQEMSLHNLKNIQTIDFENFQTIERRYLHSHRKVQNVCTWVFGMYPNIDIIRIHFVKETFDIRPKVIQSSKFIIIESFNDIYKKAKDAYFEFSKLFNPIPQIPYDEHKYTQIQFDSLIELDRLKFFTSCLKGILYFYETYTNKTSFDVFSYNSTIESIDGKNSMYIYNEGVKWFDDHSKKFLNNSGYEFPDLIPKEYSNEKDYHFNDEYYNDNLDMNQQSPEFWDSL
jgi:hypothetical protein